MTHEGAGGRQDAPAGFRVSGGREGGPEGGSLFVVGTPIGNLADVSERVRETLAGVDRILAEDTRRTRVLTRHLGVGVPLVSLHAHNEAARVESVLEWLAAGESLALVSDAGTPLVSDPGERVLAAVVHAGYRVVPIPGPSAVLSALVASGLPADRFTFLGFPDRKGPGRTALLERVAGSLETTILFESPNRLVALLEDLQGACGGGRRVCVAREVTKLHEEFRRGTCAEVAAYYEEHPARGEVTVVVAPADNVDPDPRVLEQRARSLAVQLLAEGGRPSGVAKELASALGLPRNQAYRIVQEVDGAP